jgi:hypothetical protein
MQVGAAASNARSAAYFQLLRGVLEDFATQFRSGAADAAKAAPPPPAALLAGCGAPVAIAR